MVGSADAVFFDKDGTLIEDVPYNVDPARVRLAEGAAGGLRALHSAGFLLFVVSNQAGVALGRFEEEALDAVERRLKELAAENGADLAGVYFCPHHPRAACPCRKPKPGLILRALSEHDVDPARSWMVGDILDDVEAGRRAGLRTILLDRGHETEWRLTPERSPDLKARDVSQAARLILRASR